MVDYTEQLYAEAFPNAASPPELEQQRAKTLAQHDKLGAEVDVVLKLIEDPSVRSALKQDKEKNLQWLQQNYDITVEQINSLYHYGYFQFSCGNYGEASQYLYHFRILSTDATLTLSSHWGKLASDILTGEWDNALEEIKLIREQIDATPHRGSYNDDGGAEALLQKRTWLLHWSLFVWFNHPEGRQGLVEMYLSPPYLNTIQTTSWWLLRYLVSALILTRRTTRVYMVPTPNTNPQMMSATSISKVSPTAALRDVTRIVLSESGYRLSADSIVDFLAKLYGDFDFEAAQQELAKAEKAIEGDFFLQEHKDSLLEGARFLISEAYTRIHQRVNIADLSQRLNLSQEAGEKWIVNLVRDTRSDAKIDFKEGVVKMNLSSTHPPIYQSIIDATRGFTYRTASMGQAIDQKAHPNREGQRGGQQQQRGEGGQRGGRGGSRGGRGGASTRTGGQRNQQQRDQSQQQQQSTDEATAPTTNGTAPSEVAQEAGA